MVHCIGIENRVSIECGERDEVNRTAVGLKKVFKTARLSWTSFHAKNIEENPSLVNAYNKRFFGRQRFLRSAQVNVLYTKSSEMGVVNEALHRV